MKITKVFKSGNSQAVRLPKEFNVNDKELHIEKTGNKIYLFPVKEKWNIVFEELSEIANLSKDFLEDREQPAPQDRELF